MILSFNVQFGVKPEIVAKESQDIQIKLFLDGKLLPIFFSYGSEWIEEDIKTDLVKKLDELGYIL